MCQDCDKEVIEMGILESDLPNLPYKPMYWQCSAVGCMGKARIRDYGITPFYFWPVKVIREVDKKGVTKWRGGWVNYDHAYICSKHWPAYKESPRVFFERYLFEPLGTTDSEKVNEYLRSKIIEPINKSKWQRQVMQNWKRSEGW